ncbi:hypothetical protein ACVW0P_000106 [Mucilaginibacter sp. UYNi724]
MIVHRLEALTTKIYMPLFAGTINHNLTQYHPPPTAATINSQYLPIAIGKPRSHPPAIPAATMNYDPSTINLRNYHQLSAKFPTLHHKPIYEQKSIYIQRWDAGGIVGVGCNGGTP